MPSLLETLVPRPLGFAQMPSAQPVPEAQPDPWIRDPMMYNALQSAARLGAVAPAAGYPAQTQLPPYQPASRGFDLDLWTRILMTLAPYAMMAMPFGAGRVAPPLAPASYRGFQEGYGNIPGFHLYNLTKNVRGHPAGSTVGAETLQKLGYRVPPPPQP